MRLLERNLTDFEYLPYTGQDSDLNEYGEHTGESYPEYGDPIPYRGNISSPSGHTQQSFYGITVPYTHVLVMADPDTDIQETGLIRWQGHLYTITAVRPSINALSVALKRQPENHADGEQA